MFPQQTASLNIRLRPLWSVFVDLRMEKVNCMRETLRPDPIRFHESEFSLPSCLSAAFLALKANCCVAVACQQAMQVATSKT